MATGAIADDDDDEEDDDDELFSGTLSNVRCCSSISKR